MFLSADPSGLTQRLVSLPTGVELNVVERPGTGMPVIALHGLWAWWRTWRPLLPPGPGSFNGRPILLPDLRGHGESGKPAAGYSLEAAADDIVALVRQQGIERFTLAGHSLGALVSLLVAAAIPNQIENMLLEDPPLPMPAEAEPDDGADSWLDFAASTLELYTVKSQPLTEIAATLQTRFPALSPADAEEAALCVSMVADGVFVALLENADKATLLPPGTILPMPTLVIRAGKPDDRMLRDRGVDQLRAMLPRMQLATVPDSGHWVLGSNPIAYRALIARFFEEG